MRRNDGGNMIKLEITPIPTFISFLKLNYLFLTKIIKIFTCSGVKLNGPSLIPSIVELLAKP